MPNRDAVNDVNGLIATEWVLPNATGGYASGTIAGLNTRKYHGLLIGGFELDGSRHLFVGGLEESLVVSGKPHMISTHKYSPDAIFPMGYRHLQAWEITEQSVRYDFGEFDELDLQLTKQISVVPGVNGVRVDYDIRGRKRPFQLTVSPLITYRDIHTVRTSAPYHSERGDGWQSPDQFNFRPEIWTIAGKKYGAIAVTAAGNTKSLYMISSTTDYARLDEWYHNFQYDLEIQRGYEAIEDLLCPGTFRSALGERHYSLCFVLADSVLEAKKALKVLLAESEITPTTLLSSTAESADLAIWQSRLEVQMKQFVVQNNKGKPSGLVAGYPWFGMWSRDTLLSLPGLLHAAGGAEIVKGILSSHFAAVVEGQLPNILEEKIPRYDFVADSPLLLILALHAYMRETGDIKFLRSVWAPALSIVRRYLNLHENNGQYCDRSGLVYFVADGHRAATWMDAIVDGRAVTPRYGAPVEIQALWYNTISAIDEWGTDYALDTTSLEAALLALHQSSLTNLRNTLRESITDRYWLPELGYFADFIAHDGTVNRQLRPNQLFLAGLPFPCIDREQAGQMLRMVKDKLLTPVGLKTLSPDDPQYQASYQGGQAKRDLAYHQGTIWPWLLGVYGRALLLAEGSASAKTELTKYLSELLNRMEAAQLAYLPEVFSAHDLSPHGTIHQAWNVAEILTLVYLVGDDRPTKKEK